MRQAGRCIDLKPLVADDFSTNRRMVAIFFVSVSTLVMASALVGLLQSIVLCAAEVERPETKIEAVFRSQNMLVQVGPRELILPAGAQGLNYFPDLCFSLIQTNPTHRVLLAAGVSTWLLEGPDMKSLRTVGKVLTHGPAGSCDNGYAGISSAIRDGASGRLLAFYHAEDQEGRPRNTAGVPGFHCSIALAVSKDDGRSFDKIGPVLTSVAPKMTGNTFDQGCGEPCVIVDRDRRFLLAYYVDHSRWGGRGVQICLARSPLVEGGRPGTWLKYYDGAFSEPGLGGKDTPIVSAKALGADALFPYVTYAAGLGKYVMAFNINAYAELNAGRAPRDSGLYLAHSDDGVHWSPPRQLLAAYAICQLDKEVVWHPTLMLEAVDAGTRTAKGWLYYGYSDRWGHAAPRKPHHLVGHRIELSLKPR